ncbi:Vacuolar protein sorting-associated protein 26C [Acropora cervicornis]|uniref:Vacuolar protein sorting-associated protein 26C n=1 Tax=Acropora cervicornis TaxID=6130 RepID=A0AAD9VGW1_ACRCE|nr:Vacuolar protein sorting-associated protein 26C [Acropora cervicornis]
MASLEIRLKRVNKIFHEGDIVKGVIAVQSRGELTHNGITLAMDGTVNLQLSAKSVGVFEAFYNSIKPIQLVNCTLELPFEIPLKPKGNKPLHETYHGVFVNIQPPSKMAEVKPIHFSITPESLENVKERAKVPKFLVKGVLDSVQCPIKKPFTGEIAEGDVCRGLGIPIYMIFPRLFTCPSLATANFKVEFEVNVVIILQDDHLITENFPIKIARL